MQFQNKSLTPLQPQSCPKPLLGRNSKQGQLGTEQFPKRSSTNYSSLFDIPLSTNIRFLLSSRPVEGCTSQLLRSLKLNRAMWLDVEATVMGAPFPGWDRESPMCDSPGLFLPYWGNREMEGPKDSSSLDNSGPMQRTIILEKCLGP